MRAVFYMFLFMLACNYQSSCQKSRVNNQLGFSVPIILNHSEATFYRLGSPQYPSGTAISYGANINYSKHIYKNVYAIVGIGYFRQRFQIIRPFDYETRDNLGYATESYRYDNLQIFGGVGYRQVLNETVWLKVEATYNRLHSFRQKYINDKQTWQVNRESFPIGHMLFLCLGGEHALNHRLGIGLNVVLPILHQWNDDDMFFVYDWGPGTQQIARNKYSIGINISCHYNF